MNETNSAVPTEGSIKPRHIAIIMDGNNRWAKKRMLPGGAGHKAGVEAIRDVLEACKKHGVEVLTLFAFSSENWRRPEKEVSGLMRLFLSYLKNETRKLKDNGVRLRVIGERDRFDRKLLDIIEWAERETDTPEASTTLVIAADYGGQWDIAQAAQRLAQDVQSGTIAVDDITPEALGSNLCLADLPDPDLCIRTGGEQRISNFMLWQFAYAELYFSDCYWPDFGEADLDKAIADYGCRQRRFGQTVEQVAGRGVKRA